MLVFLIFFTFIVLWLINRNSLDDVQYCYMKQYNLKQEAPGQVRRRLYLNHSTLNIHIRNNGWQCDCQAYEIISAIFWQVQNLEQSIDTRSVSQKYSKSCYLTYLVSLNSYIFENFLNNIDTLSSLKCYEQQASNNWLLWYTKTCLKLGGGGVPITPIIQTTTNDYAWLSTYKKVASNTTDPNSLLKYDISNSFYWVASVCISLITLSCVFIAWFYCWKRYSLSRRILMLQRSRLPAPVPAARRPHSHRTHSHHQRTRCQQNNAYLLSSRLGNVPVSSSSDPTSELDSSGSDRPVCRETVTLNRTSNNWRHAVNTNPNGLYYISLNRNAHNRGIRFESHMNDLPVVDNEQFYDNGAYIMNGEDEPPNYYDCLLVKNRIATLVNSKNSAASVQELSAQLDVERLNSLISESEGPASTGGSASSTATNELTPSLHSDSNNEDNLTVNDEATLNDATAISVSLDSSDSTVTYDNRLDFSQDSLDRNRRLGH